MKICIKCGKEYPPTSEYFYRDSKTLDLLNAYCKSCSRDSSFKSRYNITTEEYNDKFKEQEGKCEICGKHQKDLDRALCVDHNHDTGKNRGLLCSNCNSMLGFALDKTSILINGSKYIQKYIK